MIIHMSQKAATASVVELYVMFAMTKKYQCILTPIKSICINTGVNKILMKPFLFSAYPRTSTWINKP